MAVNPKYLRLIVALMVIAIIGLALAFSGESKLHNTESKPKTVVGCGPYRTDRVVTISAAKFNTEVVTTKADKQKGLGGRPCIEPNQAMLFVFDKPGRLPMWMKDMKFPIDIVWVTASHRAAGIEIDVAPSTYPDSFVNKDIPAQYVLELKANTAKKLGMQIGTPVSF